MLIDASSSGCAISKVNGAARLITSSKTGQGSVKGRGSSMLLLASKPSFILLISTALLLLLFLSAAFLLYRISLIQNQFIENPLLSGGDHLTRFTGIASGKTERKKKMFLEGYNLCLFRYRPSIEEQLVKVKVTSWGKGETQRRVDREKKQQGRTTVMMYIRKY
ncbi:hypothetical protein J437_LFUL017149 [Ladona fulva]|uniref:Uncharacterized protein n=1 Tax=Ladona fulva TaxID=123851 RepID=A0A8K0NZQ2_LADFU|nr:hypothetical protein J437_LFUL017149 [Ladona fulva]